MSAVPPFNLPVNIGPNGPQPQSPSTLLTQLQAQALALSPGLTNDLPSSLIEDITSTEVAGLSILDQARVEAINSVSPNSANAFILTQQGRALGFQLGLPTNTSVIVVFTGTPGYVIPAGFRVGDGSHVYAVLSGGVIGSNSNSLALTAVSVAPGPFAVPANTVTQLLTSPGQIQSVNNPQAGIPALPPESWGSFRFRVQQGQLADCTTGPRLFKTLIGNVPGVPSNLVAVQAAPGGFRVIVGGGGDVIQIAYAIFSALGGNPSSILQGSAIDPTRNIVVTLYDPPDQYQITFVQSPAQALTANVTWNTSQPNFVGGAAFPSLTQADMAAYINSLSPGQLINVLELNELFADDVAPVLPTALLDRLVFALSINGVPTPAGAGTYGVAGDPESYFTTDPAGSGFTVQQG